MSQVKVSGNASGTGVFEIAAPNSNTNRTLTLPDATGTVMVQTSTGTNITPGTKYQVGGVTTNALAWVNYAANTSTKNASYNVSSITVNSTGKYLVNFATALTDANYSAVATWGNTAGYWGYGANLYSQTTSGFNIEISTTTASANTAPTYLNPVILNIAVFGN